MVMIPVKVKNSTLYNCDCMDMFKQYPDNYFDLIITSPPYNLGNNHHTGNKYHNPYDDDMPENKYQDWQIEILNECFRVLKQNGSMMYNHKNRIKNGIQISPYQWLLKCKFLIKQEIVWFNGSQNFDKIRFYPMTERIYWMSKSGKTTLSNEINHHDFFNKDEWGAEGTNKHHTRAFPVKMIESLLLCFPEAKLILDPFMGSGSTAIACENLKKFFIGSEINKEYFELAKKRIERESQQERLF